MNLFTIHFIQISFFSVCFHNVRTLEMTHLLTILRCSPPMGIVGFVSFLWRLVLSFFVMLNLVVLGHGHDSPPPPPPSTKIKIILFSQFFINSCHKQFSMIIIIIIHFKIFWFYQSFSQLLLITPILLAMIVITHLTPLFFVKFAKY